MVCSKAMILVGALLLVVTTQMRIKQVSDDALAVENAMEKMSGQDQEELADAVEPDPTKRMSGAAKRGAKKAAAKAEATPEQPAEQPKELSTRAKGAAKKAAAKAEATAEAEEAEAKATAEAEAKAKKAAKRTEGKAKKAAAKAEAADDKAAVENTAAEKAVGKKVLAVAGQAALKAAAFSKTIPRRKAPVHFAAAFRLPYETANKRLQRKQAALLVKAAEEAN